MYNSGELKQKNCHWNLDNRYPIRMWGPIVSVAEGDVVFLKISDIPSFLSNPPPKPVKLVIHNSDETFEEAHYDWLLRSDRVQAVAAVNCNSTRAVQIPLGFRDDQYTPHSLFDDVKNSSNSERDVLCFVNFSIETNRNERSKCLDYFKAQKFSHTSSDYFDYTGTMKFTDIDNQSRRRAFYEMLKRSKFVVCPQGTGVDTHRVYEALFFGAIPIVKTSFLDKMYKSVYPSMVIVKNWEDVTEEFLLSKLMTISYSQQGEDMFVYKHFINQIVNDGVYLEIGGYDGLTYSNTKFFEDVLNFRGILIEPVKSQFDQLVVNRGCRNKCINCAIDNEEKEVEMATIDKDMSQLNCVVSNTVQAYKLSTLLKDEPFVDFFSLDVEGGEENVLESIDFDATEFYVICIELDGEKGENCREILLKQNFRFYDRLCGNEFWINDKYSRKNKLYTPQDSKFIFSSWFHIEPHCIEEVKASLITFVTYGSPGYDQTKKRLLNEAKRTGIFEQCIGYGETDLDEDFKRSNEPLLSQKRGAGYWCWKPHLIWKTMNALPDDHWILYADAGCNLVKDRTSQVQNQIKMMEKKGQLISAYQLPYQEKQWTKSDLLVCFGVMENPLITDTNQYVGGVFLVKNHPKMRAMFEKMKELMQYSPKLIDDTPSKVPNNILFKEHRYDQSMFSIMRKLSPEITFVIPKDETWHGNAFVQAGRIRKTDGAVSLLIPVCSRNSTLNCLEETPLFTTFLPAFERTKSLTFNYEFFIGIDSDDVFYMQYKHRLEKLGFHIVILDGCQHKPAVAWNKLLQAAVEFPQSSYFFQVGDDVELTTKGWTARFVEKLKEMGNVGIVGPCNPKNNRPLIIENAFFHKTHHMIFKTLFHPKIENWYCDDWIFLVYNHFQKAHLFVDVTCENTITRTRYDIKQVPDLNEYVNEGIAILNIAERRVVPKSPQPLKICLNMIVKNEAHIILEGLNCIYPLIDTYVIVDTGSTDNTKELIKTFFDSKGIQGHICDSEWKDFGTNRSEALQLCSTSSIGVDYVIVMDADDLISFDVGYKTKLINFLTLEMPNAVSILIDQNQTRYYRTQIFKTNDNWKYVGVVHEYPTNDNPNSKIMKITEESFFMTSRRLGDRNKNPNKMKKDIEVLLKGLESEPNNSRYVFYLAQSYKDDYNFPKAIEYYRKRFELGGWFEEVYYSAYMIVLCNLSLGDVIEAEYWTQKAFVAHPKRAEALYLLVKHFRTLGQFYKCYHYIEQGRKIAYPKDDVLFIEKFPHEGGFEYDASIVEYYLFSEKSRGLRTTFRYLSKQDEYKDNVISNMRFYVEKVKGERKELKITVGDPLFHPTAISLIDFPYANVRFVNYTINGDSYDAKDGGKVITKNAHLNLETGECVEMTLDKVPPFESKVSGIEDVRVWGSGEKLRFTGVSYYEYIQPMVSVVHGEYNLQTHQLSNIVGVNSPFNQTEKNWVNVSGTEDFVYGWHPLRVGKIRGNQIIFFKSIETPKYFSLFRGSTPSVEVDGCLLFLVHMVEYSTPRKYYHLFVQLEKETFRPLKVSLPFYFQKNEIEYCISMRVVGSHTVIECFITLNDKDPCSMLIKLSDIIWMEVGKE